METVKRITITKIARLAIRDCIFDCLYSDDRSSVWRCNMMDFRVIDGDKPIPYWCPLPDKEDGDD